MATKRKKPEMDPRELMKQARRQMTDAVDRLAAEVDQRNADAGFRGLLRGMARLWRYGWFNTWHIASDERRTFLRLAREHLGEDRILNTPGILVQAIGEGHLTVATADEYKQVLAAHRFVMRFDSFGDVVR